MNKKGDESSPWAVLIAGAVALVVLALVYFFLFGPGKYILVERFSIIIPGLNLTKPLIEEDVRIGYNIAQDKAKFYDGVNWYDFSEKEFGDRKVNAVNAANYFRNYYYSTPRELPYEIVLGEKTNNRIGKQVRMYNKVIIEKFDTASKSVVLDVQYRDYNLGYPLTEQYFIVTLGNKLYEGEKISETELGRVAYGSPLQTETELAQILVYNDALNFVGSSLRVHLQALNKAKIMKSIIGNLVDENGAVKKDYELKKLQKEIEGAQYQFYFKGVPLEIYLSIIDGEKTPFYAILARGISTKTSKEFDSHSIDSPELEIINKAVAWRDSIFAKPMSFKFEGESGLSFYCVGEYKLTNSELLVIIPDERVSGQATCPVS